jgi:DNA primase
MTGKMSGFGARILNPEDMPKFLNSPQTVLFDKGRLLYGLDQARKAIRSQDQVVIVEGYLDVIVLHQGGFTNTVSPMGTALTEDQLRTLKRFTRRVVLALDADAAGEKATLRGLEIARQAMDRSDEMGFDARGLLRHEARLDADVRVTAIPEGMDPDEVVLRNPEEWTQILSAARPIVVHVMETLAASRDLEDPKVKREIAQQVLPLIEDVPDPVERDAYRQRLARLIKVDERALAGDKAAVRPRRRPALNRPPTRSRPEVVDAGGSRQAQAMELHCLKLLVRQPEAIYPIDRMLLQAGLQRFSPQDFDHTDHQLLARLLLEAQEQDQLEPGQHLAAQLPDHLQPLLEVLRAPLADKEPTAERMQEDLLRTLVNLRLLKIMEGLQQMRYMQQDAPDQDSTLFPYQDMILQYTAARGKLEQILSKPIQFD